MYKNLDRFKYIFALALAFSIFVLSSCSSKQSPAPETTVSLDSSEALADVVASELSEKDKVYNDSYADYYDLNLEEFKGGSELTIIMESEDFLPHLYLLDAATGKMLVESDKNKLLSTQAKGGTTSLTTKASNIRYKLIATSLGKALGNYNLVLCLNWVRNNSDSGSGSLRAAVANAGRFGAICFDSRVFYDEAPEASRTIALESEIVIDRNVYIYGPGTGAATVSGEGFTRVFKVLPNTRSTIRGLTITKGEVGNGDGGAIWNQGTLTLKDSAITESSAGKGGGIYNDGSSAFTGSLVLENTKVKSNNASNGGGIFNQFAILTLKRDSVVIGNTATNGAGIYNAALGGASGNLINLTMQSNSSVTGNTASFGGGGIFNDGEIVLKDFSSITSNVANTWGGGVYNNVGKLTMQGLAVISGNRAGNDGGGIYNDFGTLSGIVIGGTGANVLGNQPNNLAP